MIGKIIKGKSFKGCLSYVLGKKDVKLLDGEGILLADTRSIINSFYMQSLMNPGLAKCVGHLSLSYHKEDTAKLTDAFMVQLAKEYMKEMKIGNTQYIIARHHDTAHPHCHIVFNRVDNDGKTISDKNDLFRNGKVTKALKEKYGLYFGGNKENINRQSLREPEKTKMKIYDAIKATLKQSKNWNQFEDLLKKQGIEIKFKFKGNSSEVQGLSFSKGIYSFKGSEIDRNFSFSKLDSRFQEKIRHVSGQPGPSNERSKQSKPIDQTHRQSQQSQNFPASSILDAALEVVGELGFGQYGEDYQEEVFAKRMRYEDRKRKAKNKKRGRSL